MCRYSTLQAIPALSTSLPLEGSALDVKYRSGLFARIRVGKDTSAKIL
jgi:hypothetical protein